MSSRLTTEPLGEDGGGIVRGKNAAEPLDPETSQALHDLYVQHGLLLLRDQSLSPAQHIEFSRVFGGLDVHPIPQIRLEGHPEIIALSNADRPVPPGDEDKVIGQIPWHSDLTYTVRPSRGALLYAKVVPPEGGQTGFIDTAAAYDALSDQMKQRIEGLEVLHSASEMSQSAVEIEQDSSENSKGANQLRSAQVYVGEDQFKGTEFPDVIHPLVVTHPESGRKALNVSPSFARRILDLPEGEAAEPLQTLIKHATAPRFAYIHDWRVGDIMIWDNWRTMHMAKGYKARHIRTMHRTTLTAEYEMGRIAA